ncbi:KAP family NTPase [Acinetobacter dispersus]|uniref:P-loop NTPase fold protein n=1 Tax=Acinetobacter dispersus TaxID=70348 RepID=UPI001F4AEFF2|nr:P-loop NTPase fold protein [Acinetobacter dispersus]MCH7394608.1 KAP family NTPase [Acinetobacter dispersus]
MNVLEKEKRLKELLEHNIQNEKIGTVIAITGPWGVGKTFFWKKFLKEVTHKEINDKKSFYYEASRFNYESTFDCRKYAYISLFGIENLSDLKNTICTKLSLNPHAKSDSNRFEFFQLFKNIVAQFRDMKVSQYGVSASARILESLLFLQVNDAIICFDDFERMSSKLDINDVMGLANYLKLEKNCQIILILAEDKAEDNNKQKYAEYKEKLIDGTLIINSVEPLIHANSIEVGIDEPLVKLMIEFAETLEIHNFRFFQKVLKLYQQFRKDLPEEVAESTKEIILIRVLQGYLIQDFSQLEYGWEDCQYFMEKKRENWSDRKKQTYESLQKVSDSFNREDEWLIEFKKWFEQRDNINFKELNKLANSELISDENQNIKNKLWRIFEKRHDLTLEEQDLEYIASLGQKCIVLESFHNTAFMYEILRKYLPDEVKAEKFKAEIIDYIDSDPTRSIVRANKERQLWGNENNIFYTYVDDLARDHVEEKSLKNILSHFLRYGNFESDNDKDQLRAFPLDEWFKYLTEEIYQESFFVEENDSLIQYLKRLYLIPIEDGSIRSIVLSVLQKIGEDSEFKKRYMQDIIENHLLEKA